MYTPSTSVTSRIKHFIQLIILSDSKDEDTTLPVVYAPSSPDRVLASSGYSMNYDLDSEHTEDDSSNEDLSEIAKSPQTQTALTPFVQSPFFQWPNELLVLLRLLLSMRQKPAWLMTRWIRPYVREPKFQGMLTTNGSGKEVTKTNLDNKTNNKRSRELTLLDQITRRDMLGSCLSTTSLIILSDPEDEDTTLPVVYAPSSPDRVPASSGYSMNYDLDSEHTEDDSSNEDLTSPSLPPPSLLPSSSYNRSISPSPPLPPVSPPLPPLPPFPSSLPLDMLTPHREGSPSTSEIRESSSAAAHILVVTVREMPLERVEAIEDDTETVQARLTSAEHRITELLDERDTDRLEMA
nr:hypothetical protein [Tanacetum cinerariifolium]